MFFGNEKGLTVTTAKTIKESANYRLGKVSVKTDVVIVGSGAGGSMAAYRLSLAGYKVVVLEAGQYITSHEFEQKNSATNMNAYAESGVQFCDSGDVNILQGKCVGGSTAVADSLMMRAPKEVLRDWHEQTGLDIFLPENMTEYYDEVEQQMHVRKVTTDSVDTNGLRAIIGAEKNHLSWHLIKRNAVEKTRKVSALISYLPWSKTGRCDIYSETYVNKVTTQNGRATGVEATVIDAETGKKVVDVSVSASIVILAAGAIQTPQILLRSAINDAHNNIGANLSLNPYASVTAEYEDTLEAWKGVDVAMVVDDYLPLKRGGALIVPQMRDPAGMVLNNRLAPKYQMRMMSKYNHLTNVNAYVLDDNNGRVSWEADGTPFGKANIDWEIGRETQRRLKKMIAHAARIHFAAGAKYVYLPISGNGVVRNLFDLDAQLANNAEEHPFVLQSVAPQGTCRMHGQPEKGVVSGIGEVHHVKGVFVADASLLPSCLPVMPELTVYALSSYIADEIIKREKDYFLPE